MEINSYEMAKKKFDQKIERLQENISLLENTIYVNRYKFKTNKKRIELAKKKKLLQKLEKEKDNIIASCGKPRWRISHKISKLTKKKLQTAKTRPFRILRGHNKQKKIHELNLKIGKLEGKQHKIISKKLARYIIINKVRVRASGREQGLRNIQEFHKANIYEQQDNLLRKHTLTQGIEARKARFTSYVSLGIANFYLKKIELKKGFLLGTKETAKYIAERLREKVMLSGRRR